MKGLKVALTAGVIFAAAGGFATEAQAGGTSATNTYVHGNRHVVQKVNSHNVNKVVGNFDNSSTSLKMTTDFPIATGTISFDGTNLTGSMDVSTRNIDPSLIGTTSTSNEWGTYTDTTKTDVSQTSVGNDRIFSHTTSSSFGF